MQRWPAVPMAAKATRAQREVEVGRGRDDRGVVAAELEDRAAEARREPRRRPARPMAVEPVAETSGTRGSSTSDLADVAPADQHLGQALRRVAEARRRALERAPATASAVSGVFSDGFQTTRIAADEGERRVPRPHRDRES